MFWKVGSSATLGTGTVLAGNILALTSITMNAGVALHGRALARNGAVTLINDTITAPHCATAPAGPPGRELDVAAALPADPGIGANQRLLPNHAVEPALVQAGLDPTRAHWSKATWGSNAWARATWAKGGGAEEPGRPRQRRCAVGARHLERAHVPGGRPRAAVGVSDV